MEVERRVGRRSLSRCVVVPVRQNPTDGGGFSNEGDHAEFAAARTQQRVEFEDSSNQICPPTPQSLFSGGAQGRLVFLSLDLRRNGLLGRLRNLPPSSNHVCVVPIVKQ